MVAMTQGCRIARNRKRFIDGLFAHATNCVRWRTEWNGNQQTACTPDELRAEFWEEPDNYLRWIGGQSYTVHIHHNLWYRFDSFAPDSATALNYGPRVMVRA